MRENCASCKRFTRCNDPNKATSYICGKYKPLSMAQLKILADLSHGGTEDSALEELEVAASKPLGDELDEVLNLNAMITTAMDPSNAIPPDLKVDDRDIKQAPNFYTFCMSPKGLNQPPLPKQFALFTHLFNEWCPRKKCTDLKLFADHRDFPTDFKMKDVPERITLLRYGVCPNCGGTKSDYIKKGKLPDPQELVLVCGQRCVTGDTIIHTEHGMMTMGELAKINECKPGYTPLQIEIASNTPTGMATTSQFYVAEREQLITVHLKGELSITGTADHPILTTSGWIKLGEIVTGDQVVLQIGHNLYGDDTLDAWELGAEVRRSMPPKVWAESFPLLKDRNVVCSLGWKNQVSNEDLALLAGMIASHHDGTRIISKNKSAVSRANDVLTKLWGANVWTDEDKIQGITHLSTGVYPNLVVSEWFKAFMGYNPILMEDAEIPIWVRRGSKRVVLKYLEGMYITHDDSFLADGGLIWTTRSLTHARQIHSMLHNLGIMCQIDSQKLWYIDNEDPPKEYMIYIDAFNVEEFCELINDPDDYVIGQDTYADTVQMITNNRIEETYDVTVPGCHNFIANGIVSHNSGKSIGVSLAQAYLLQWWLKSQSLTSLYQQTANTHFTNSLVALTFKRAKDLLFQPLLDMVDSSPWFQDYLELLNDVGERHGEEIFIKGKEMIAFKHRQLVVHPMHPSKRLLRGDTRTGSCADEFGYFAFGEGSDDRERASASEVYESLDNSMATVRGAYDERIQAGYNNVPNAYGLWTSSPSAFNDQIMTLKRTLEGSDLAVVGHYASLEFNPRVKRNSSFMRKKYLSNPIKAERDFGANPPMSESPFIENPVDVLHCFQVKNQKNTISYNFATNRKSSKPRRYAKLTGNLGSPGPSFMALDAGLSYNSFAMAVGHLGDNDRPIVTALCEIAPKDGKQLDLSLIFDEIIMPVIRSHNVVRVYIDRWNSAKILQDIEKLTGDNGPDEMTEGVQYSLRKDDILLVIDYMKDGMGCPILPKLERASYEKCIQATDVSNYPHNFANEPASHLMFQLATIQETSKTIDKGTGYTDDIFRAVSLLLAWLYDEDGVEFIKTRAARNVRRTPPGLIVGVTKTGGSISGGNGGGGTGTSNKALVATTPFGIGSRK